MKYDEAKELMERMTKWHETHKPHQEFPLHTVTALKAMKALALEITRLSGLLADEILASEDLPTDLNEADNWPSDSVWPPEILSVEEIIEEESYEDPPMD